MDGLIDVLQVVALALLALRARRIERTLDYKVNRRFQIGKDLYERANRRLNEHIKAPIHRR